MGFVTESQICGRSKVRGTDHLVPPSQRQTLSTTGNYKNNDYFSVLSIRRPPVDSRTFPQSPVTLVLTDRKVG